MLAHMDSHFPAELSSDVNRDYSPPEFMSATWAHSAKATLKACLNTSTSLSSSHTAAYSACAGILALHDSAIELKYCYLGCDMFGHWVEAALPLSYGKLFDAAVAKFDRLG